MVKILLASSLVLLPLLWFSSAGAANKLVMKEGKVYVKMTTSKGDIVLELNKDKAPVTVENFVAYVKDGFYDGLIFHRVINGFMIQGGGMDKNMREKPGKPPITNEADNGLANDAYTIAMARTMDPHSASSQFFINVKDNSGLNHTGKNPRGWGYAVFGKVVEGKEVVDAIKVVNTGSKGYHDDVPTEPIEIVKCVVLEK
jgi:peptidyl-prolyl cis-trans isomerase B (cyclophilin B)